MIWAFDVKSININFSKVWYIFWYQNKQNIFDFKIKLLNYYNIYKTTSEQMNHNLSWKQNDFMNENFTI